MRPCSCGAVPLVATKFGDGSQRVGDRDLAEADGVDEPLEFGVFLPGRVEAGLADGEAELAVAAFVELGAHGVG